METKRLTGDRISVMVADDQVLFSQGLRRLFEISAPDIEVIGTAATGRELIDHVERREPDVILMDVRMPDIDGVEATRILHSRYPKVRIIMLTTFDDDEYVTHAVKYGAVGYLLKDIPPEELFDAVRMVRSHSFIASTEVLRKIATPSPSSRPRSNTIESEGLAEGTDAALSDLTEREREVVGLILAEYDNRCIAEELCLSERTVRNYVSNVYAKLGVQNRFQLIRCFRSRF